MFLEEWSLYILHSTYCMKYQKKTARIPKTSSRRPTGGRLKHNSEVTLAALREETTTSQEQLPAPLTVTPERIAFRNEKNEKKKTKMILSMVLVHS